MLIVPSVSIDAVCTVGRPADMCVWHREKCQPCIGFWIWDLGLSNLDAWVVAHAQKQDQNDTSLLQCFEHARGGIQACYSTACGSHTRLEQNPKPTNVSQPSAEPLVGTIQVLMSKLYCLEWLLTCNLRLSCEVITWQAVLV